MAERSYSKSQLIKIIRDALALALHWGGQLEGPSVPPTAGYRKAADKMPAEGVDLDTALIALRRYLRHSRAQSPPPADFRDPQWLGSRKHWQSVTLREVARDKAAALAILRAALVPAGPFITIPELGKAFHIRYGSDISGMRFSD
jgi:hypothetical protein